MDQSYLDGLTYHSKEGQVSNDNGLDLNESCCHVIPDIDQVQNCVPNKLTQVWIWLESTWKSHEPLCLLLKHLKLQPLSDPMEHNESTCRLRMEVDQK